MTNGKIVEDAPVSPEVDARYESARPAGSHSRSIVDSYVSIEQESPLQQQQEGETDNAYLAYRIYRNMESTRSYEAGYSRYLEESKPTRHMRHLAAQSGDQHSDRPRKRRKPSGKYYEWIILHRWVDRIKDWEDSKNARIQAALVARNTEAFIAEVEDGRTILSQSANLGLQSGLLTISIGYNQLQKIAELAESKGENGERLDEKELEAMALITRNNEAAMRTVAIAKEHFSDSMGLVKTIDMVSALQDDV